MSYILEALKKLEQKKRRGEGTRLLSDGHAEAGQSKRPLWPYLLVFALILNAGLLLWWLHPWHRDNLQTRVTTQEGVHPGTAPPSREESAGTEVSKPAPPGIHREPASEHPARDAATQGPAAKAEAQPSGQTVPDDRTAAPPVDMRYLPPALKQALPDLTISGHFFDAEPSFRLMIIDGRTLREGQTVAPGLKLERITPDGAIFSYQGTRFIKRIF